ncbi:hypothetical protein VFPPC_17526 [Pochonia chlamydosporia 170]|uniref:Uncharacterized protein n=1 Tax=Pochonia chlamydosporia 170 TaxID=1380566 RepID=A0A219ARC2_METCM|nr:hypothetical protein VFPPC_17526 [Pochonia chlamydosporia 170]OWT43311.1 hypothetical protein VFPPC_17526 [Pochonia chlamydosporia 170]
MACRFIIPMLFITNMNQAPTTERSHYGTCDVSQLLTLTSAFPVPHVDLIPKLVWPGSEVLLLHGSRDTTPEAERSWEIWQTFVSALIPPFYNSNGVILHVTSMAPF